MAAASAAVSSVNPSPTAPKDSGATLLASRSARLRGVLAPAGVTVEPEASRPVSPGAGGGSAESVPAVSFRPLPTKSGSGVPKPVDARPSRVPGGRVSSGWVPVRSWARDTRRMMPVWLTIIVSLSDADAAGASWSMVGIRRRS